MTSKNHPNKSKEKEDMYDKNWMQFIYEDNDPLWKMFYCQESHEYKIIKAMADNWYGLYDIKNPHLLMQIKHLRATWYLFDTFMWFRADCSLKMSAMYLELLVDLRKWQKHQINIEKSLTNYFSDGTYIKDPEKEMQTIDRVSIESE